MSDCCPHPELFNSLCCICGEEVLIDTKTSSSSSTTTTTETTRSILINGNMLSMKNHNQVGATKLQSLQRTRRLVLVLDIDQTLLHCVQIDGPPPPRGIALPDISNPDIYHLPIEEWGIDGRLKHLVMKKRPHLDYFLREAQKFCEMTIYTAGKRYYAESVVKVIDPTGCYIGKRIISRCDGDATNVNSTGNGSSSATSGNQNGTTTTRKESTGKLLDNIFLQEASLAVILDDREDVWKGKQNEQLLLVRGYNYFFPGSESIRAVTGGGGHMENMTSAVPVGPATTTTTAGTEATTTAAPLLPVYRLHGEHPGEVIKFANPFSPECTEEDDQLLRSLEILKSLHAAYYEELDMITLTTSSSSSAAGSANQITTSTSVSSLQSSLHIGYQLNMMKKRILAGYTICFSGLIPTSETRPELHPLWQLAVSLGANVSMELLPRTTHLIASQSNTKKVFDSRARKDVWILKPDWLIYCRWALHHVDESGFLLVPLKSGESLPSPERNYDPLPTTSNDMKKRKREEEISSTSSNGVAAESTGELSSNKIVVSTASSSEISI